jgi:hypothetical protein
MPESHSPKFRHAPGGPALEASESPLLCGGSAAAAAACTPQLLSQAAGSGSTAKAAEPSPQSDALWAFLRSAEGQVTEVEARLAEAQKEFATLLAFFGQRVPDEEKLRTTQPAAFLGLVAKVADTICSARAQREQVKACMDASGK